LKKGIRCTVSTDDPLSFNNTLVDEYMALIEKVGLSLNDISKLIINGFMIADIPNEAKNNFRNQVCQYFLKFNDLND
jgi:adenosine deaminase